MIFWGAGAFVCNERVSVNVVGGFPAGGEQRIVMPVGESVVRRLEIGSGAPSIENHEVPDGKTGFVEACTFNEA